MPEATVTSKGQITIPKRIREELDLDTGDRVVFVLRDDGVVEMRPETVDTMSLCGLVKSTKSGVTIEDMGRAVKRRGSGR